MLLHKEESSHWYDRNGFPHHDAGIKRAREEGLFPSVTTIKNVKAKGYGLERWILQNYVESAYTFPMTGLPTNEVFRAIDEEANEKKNRAASIGTRAHNSLEEYVGFGKLVAHDGIEKQLTQVALWIDSNLDLATLQTEMIVVSLLHGFAGTIDLHGYDKNGRPIVIDYKTQDPKNGLKTYNDYIYQLAAYRLALSETKHDFEDARLLSIVISSAPSIEKIRIVEWEEDSNRGIDAKKGLVGFLAMFDLWKIEHKYIPGGVV